MQIARTSTTVCLLGDTRTEALSQSFPPVAILVHDWTRVALCALPALALGIWLTASEFPAFTRARRRAHHDHIEATAPERPKENA